VHIKNTKINAKCNTVTVAHYFVNNMWQMHIKTEY